MPIGARVELRVIAALVLRPGLWATAIAEMFLLARPGWWRCWPPLPLPTPEYTRFRVHTAYGDAVEHLDAADVIDYLKWCRRMRQVD